jgi:hypothetical protein
MPKLFAKLKLAADGKNLFKAAVQPSVEKQLENFCSAKFVNDFAQLKSIYGLYRQQKSDLGTVLDEQLAQWALDEHKLGNPERGECEKCKQPLYPWMVQSTEGNTWRIFFNQDKPSESEEWKVWKCDGENPKHEQAAPPNTLMYGCKNCQYNLGATDCCDHLFKKVPTHCEFIQFYLC